MILRLAACLLLGAAVAGCAAEEGTPFDAALAAPLCFGEGTPLFDDWTARAGVGQIHRLPEGLPYYPSNLGGGAVLRDLDGDGALDLFVSSGAGPKALYLNRGDGTFVERAEDASVSFPGDWTNGVSAADYDNDGDQDLYLLNHGKNRLLRSRGDGTFEDVTDMAGVGDAGVGASASWADVDGDGYLDLFVANLAESFDPYGDIVPGRSVLYRNRGDGTFEDVSASLGLPDGSSYLGLMFDADGDGAMDLLATQEFGTTVLANTLLRNPGKSGGSWVDISAEAGVAAPRSVMGAAVLDLEADGSPDVFLTNLWGEDPGREVLLHSEGPGRFADVAAEIGAYAAEARVGSDRPARTVSWGAAAIDVDNDGDDDLYTVYGQMVPARDFTLGGSAYPPARAGQPNALLRNDGGAFTILSGTCAEEAGRGRGVVSGDVDGDGCEDIYVVNQGGPSRLLHNRCSGAGRSFEIILTGTRSNRDAVGARVTITAGGRTQVKYVVSGTSVHSAQPNRIHVGLGGAARAETVSVRWPRGATQVVHDLAAGQVHRLVEP